MLVRREDQPVKLVRHDNSYILEGPCYTEVDLVLCLTRGHSDNTIKSNAEGPPFPEIERRARERERLRETLTALNTCGATTQMVQNNIFSTYYSTLDPIFSTTKWSSYIWKSTGRQRRTAETRPTCYIKISNRTKEENNKMNKDNLEQLHLILAKILLLHRHKFFPPHLLL